MNHCDSECDCACERVCHITTLGYADVGCSFSKKGFTNTKSRVSFPSCGLGAILFPASIMQQILLTSLHERDILVALDRSNVSTFLCLQLFMSVTREYALSMPSFSLLLLLLLLL